MMPSGVCSAGSTTQLPASAGASFHAAIRMGKFHGMICPTAQRLVEVIGHRVVIDLGQPSLLAADGRGEVAASSAI